MRYRRILSRDWNVLKPVFPILQSSSCWLLLSVCSHLSNWLPDLTPVTMDWVGAILQVIFLYADPPLQYLGRGCVHLLMSQFALVQFDRILTDYQQDEIVLSKLLNMKYLTLGLLLLTTACGSLDKRKEEIFDYKSIVGRSGDVFVQIGDSTYVFRNYKISYSNSDASTLLLKENVNKNIIRVTDDQGKSYEPQEVYIQGPALVYLK